jgi:hypothetical protein
MEKGTTTKRQRAARIAEQFARRKPLVCPDQTRNATARAPLIGFTGIKDSSKYLQTQEMTFLALR